MTLRELVQRFGKPLVIILISAFAILTVRKSLPDMAKLHPHNYGMLIAGSVLFLVTYLVGAFGWHLVLRALGQPVSLLDSARMYFLSLIARWIPGRVWYLATRIYIGRQVGLSVTTVAFGIILELIYTLLGGIIVTVTFASTLLKGLIASPHGQLFFWLLVAVTVAVGVLAIRPSALTAIGRLRIIQKVMKKIAGEDLDELNQVEITTSSSLMLMAYFGCYWIFSGFMFGVLTSAFLPMNVERWIACIPAFAGSWLIGFFSMITPAGIGVREFAMTAMLNPSMGQAAAILMSIASRVVMMFVELILAGTAFLFMRDQIGTMPFLIGKGFKSNPRQADTPLRRPAGLDVTMRLPTNSALRPVALEPAPPSTPHPRAVPMSEMWNGSRPPIAESSGRHPLMGAPTTSRLSAFSGPRSTLAKSNGRNGVATLSRTRSRSAERWTLVKRRPCFCGQEQRQNGRIPTRRYKPFKRKIRVLTEDL